MSKSLPCQCWQACIIVQDTSSQHLERPQNVWDFSEILPFRALEQHWKQHCYNSTSCRQASMSSLRHDSLKHWHYAIQNHFQADFKPCNLIVIFKNGWKIKPISMFVNLQLKTLLMGNGRLMISSIFWSISWQSLKITKICFFWRIERKFCPACIATACQKSDSSSHCRSKSMPVDFWSNPQVKKCWETKQLDEWLLFHCFSCGFVNNTNEKSLEFSSCFFRSMTFIIWPSSHRTWIPGPFITQDPATQLVKVCVLCSSQNKHIASASPAIALRSSCKYLEFLSKFSANPWLSWRSGIAFHSCQSQDYLGSSLGGGHLTWTQTGTSPP